MTNPTSDDELVLLSLCAILRWFDRELLVDLADCDQRQIADLLASDLVEPVPESIDTYQLREHVRVDILRRMRTERPLNEFTLHTRALEYFLSRSEPPRSLHRRPSDEVDCFHHLSKIFIPLLGRMEWSRITQYVASIRALEPIDPWHVQRLLLYDGYVAIRTQDYDRGEAILIDLLNQDLEDYVQLHALNALAQAYWYQTYYDRAIDFYQKLHDFAKKIGDQAYEGLAMVNMGIVFKDINYYDRALELSLQGLQIFHKLDDKPRKALALYEIGNNAMHLGKWDMAQRHFSDAHTLYKELGIMAHLAALYWCQGFLYHMLGNEEQSEEAYLHAFKIARSPEYDTPSIVMDSLSYLGFLYQTQGRWEEALTLYDQSLVSAAQLRNQDSSSLIRYRRGKIFERQGHTNDALAAYQQAIDGIEALRSKTEGEAIKIGLLGTTQQVYESIVLLCLDQGQPGMAFEYVERARSRAFLDVLAKKSPELYDKFDQPVATLAEVQAGLPPGALLLEYYTTGVLPRGEGLINQIPPENARLREHLTQPPHIIIFAITRDRFEVLHAPLNPNMLRPQPGDPSPIRRLLRGRLPAQLYDALLAPAAKLLRECKLLYIIPHGPLHYVPFAALVATHATHDRADSPAIALAPSATVLLRCCLGCPPVQPAHASPLLALGYNDQGGEEPLRYAEAEAGHIARMLGGQALVGAEPKRERLLDAGRQARWLHIAGHAFYHPRDPLESELRTGAGESLSARTIASELDLDADLVTLSSCTSGIGQVVAGDEQLGLQRAFLYAGARAVLCTLWEAADFVALLLMDRFYIELQRGRPTAVALRNAQTALRSMTGQDVATTIARWSIEDPAFVVALGELPSIPPEHLDTPLYADPIWWAPFTLIGKAD